MSVQIDITLRIDDEGSAARVLEALARAVPSAKVQQRVVERIAEQNGSEPEPVATGGNEEDDAVRAAVASKLIVRLTVGMNEVVEALAAAGGESDRGSLMSALPERSNNSIGRSLGALERAGLAKPRFEGSSHWRLSPLARAAVDGRIPMRVDRRPERATRVAQAHVGSPE